MENPIYNWFLLDDLGVPPWLRKPPFGEFGISLGHNRNRRTGSTSMVALGPEILLRIRDLKRSAWPWRLVITAYFNEIIHSINGLIACVSANNCEKHNAWGSIVFYTQLFFFVTKTTTFAKLDWTRFSRNVSCVADARDDVGWLRDIGMIIYTSMEGVRSDSWHLPRGDR